RDMLSAAGCWSSASAPAKLARIFKSLALFRCVRREPYLGPDGSSVTAGIWSVLPVLGSLKCGLTMLSWLTFPPGGRRPALPRGKPQSFCQRAGVRRRPDFGVVIEIDEDIEPLRGPAPHPPGPAGERRRIVTAGIELRRSMQAKVDKVGGRHVEARPFRRIGDHQRHAPAAQQLRHLRGAKALMPDLESIAQRAKRRWLEQGPATQDPAVAAPRQPRRAGGVPRQQRQEAFEPPGVEGHGRRKLPENGAQLRPQPQQALGEEGRQRLLDVLELFHMRDKAGALDGKDEILGRLGDPAPEARRRLQRIEGTVDLDGAEAPAGMSEPEPLRQARRIEAPAPGGIDPAGDADADHAFRQRQIASEGCPWPPQAL